MFTKPTSRFILECNYIFFGMEHMKKKYKMVQWAIEYHLRSKLLKFENETNKNSNMDCKYGIARIVVT